MKKNKLASKLLVTASLVSALTVAFPAIASADTTEYVYKGHEYLMVAGTIYQVS